MDERDQNVRGNETLSFNYETGIYEATCRLRINTHRAGTEDCSKCTLTYQPEKPIGRMSK